MMTPVSADKIVFKQINPFSQFDSVKEIWTSLLNKCPHSYYLSWAWRELWIKSLPVDCNMILVAGFRNDLPVIAFFVGRKTATRHKFFKIRRLSLNSTLIPYIDLLCIEYNAILIDPNITISLDSILDLLPIKWDEFYMPMCASIYQPNLLLNDDLSKSYNLSVTNLRSYYVDLDKVRRNNNDYLALLSPKKRQQIRRSIREYEKMGEVRTTVAQNAEEALIILDELIELHQREWTGRGCPGSFANEYFSDFHKQLISSRFNNNEIQLIRVSSGNYTIGCLYCFTYDGKALGYQCGFNFLPSNVYSPGMVCHYLAIEYYTMIGLSYYDFLEGDDSYKKSLSTDYNEMQNIVVRQRNMNYMIENTVVKIYNKIRGNKYSL